MPLTRAKERAGAPAALSDVARAANATVRSVAPRLRIERHWSGPWYVGTDLVCAVIEYGRHVGVQFWRGSSLPNPDGWLEGTGKNLRHVKLDSVENASARPLRALVRAADRLDRANPKRTR